MRIYKLIGYDEINDIYINPITNEVENLPSAPSIISATPIEGYVDSEDAMSELIALEVIRYRKRKEDGISMYFNMMSELRLNSIANNYPRIVNATIEETFKLVREYIVDGQWITAKEKCELVVVSGYITQELYDRIYTTITNYIALNY